MAPRSVTLSSVGTTGAINVDWIGGKPTTVATTLASTTMTVDYTIQFTLDDLQVTASPTWFGLSSGVSVSPSHFSSAQADNGVYASFLNPIAGLRLSSTAISSSSVTLRVLQGPGG